MLTRIEIDGFKSFEEFKLDLSPFAVILGGNASGKSNLFDAIEFLALLAGGDLRSAMKGIRGGGECVFREDAPGAPCDRMGFAVELLLSPKVRDPWGAEVELSHTRVRYELEISRMEDERGVPKWVVTHEKASPVWAKNDMWKPFGRRPSSEFRKSFLRYARRNPWLDTESDQEGRVFFKIHQDGKAGRVRPAHAAEATVLSSITTAEFPHLYALRQEIRSWRLLQLDPFGLRRPSPLTAEEELLPDGSNIAAVLHRILMETKDAEHPKGILPDIVAELASIVPGVLDVDVARDDAAREYRVTLRLRDGFEFPSAVISDGTLRVLALLTLLHDPRHRGVVCFEEPENGVHPARLKKLIGLLRSLVADPTSDEVDPEEPLSQLLMNSHSPVVLSALKAGGPPSQILFADMVAVSDPRTGQVRRKTRMREVGPSEQAQLPGTERGAKVGRFEVQRYLETASGED